MYEDVYVGRLVDSIVGNIETKKNNVIFIKHHNAINISKKDISNAVGHSGRVRILYFEYTNSTVQDAYEPFLAWVRALYQEYCSHEMSEREFVDDCDIYSLHKDVFISYLETGNCQRHEEVMISEIEYEQKQFLRSLLNAFVYLSKINPLFIVLNRIHLASGSVIKLIDKFMNEYEVTRIGLLATYNEAYVIESFYQHSWTHLRETIEHKNAFFDWGSLEAHTFEVSSTKLIINEAEIEDYLNKLNNMLYTFALEEGLFYMHEIENRIEKENFKISDEQRQRYYVLFARITLLSGDFSGALMLSEKIMESEDVSLDMKYEYNYITGLAQIASMQSAPATRAAENCKKIAGKLQDGYLEFKAEYLLNLIPYFGWINIFSCDFTNRVTDDFMEKLIEYRYNNAMAYFYAFGYDNDKDSITGIVEGNREPVSFYKGIELGTQLVNKEMILAAYLKNILLYSEYGYHEYVGAFYKKRIEIVKEDNNILREAHMYNGLGYNCIIEEHHNQANNYFNKAIEIFYKEKEIEKIAETLYNMSINCMITGEYKYACEYLATAMKCIEYMGLRSIHMCNISTIYGMMAMSSCHMSYEYNCLLYVNKMEKELQHLLFPDGTPDYHKWDIDLFFYYCVRGMVYRKNGKYEEAKIMLEKAEVHQKNAVGDKYFLYPLLVMEKADLFYRMERSDLANNVLEECIKYCNEKGYHYKVRVLMAKMQNKVEKVQKWNLSIQVASLSQIEEMAKNCGTEIQLELRKKEIKFLSNWNDSLIKETETPERMAMTSIATIQNAFNLDYVLCLKMDGERLHVVYDDVYTNLDNHSLKKIIKYFERNKKTFVVSRTEKRFVDFQDLMSVIGVKNVVSFIGIPLYSRDKLTGVMIAYVVMHNNFLTNKVLFSDDNLMVLKIAFCQFMEAYERLRKSLAFDNAENELRIVSSKDPLTGLYNRQGFCGLIEEAYVQNENLVTSILMYISLDNFKFYNEEYGHRIGDFILISFAEVIKEIVNKAGFGVRYGGDKFILVFQGKDAEYALKVVQTIFRELDGSFQREIIQKLASENIMFSNNKITATIGISEIDEYTEVGIMKALANAGKLLKHNKDNTRNSYMFWDDTKGKKEICE